MRMELSVLSAEIERLRREIDDANARVRSMLAELASTNLADRIAEHEVVTACVEAARREILDHQHQRAHRRAERDEKTQELIRTRSSRQTLERLRAEARREHLRREAAVEQKQSDDSSQVAYARKTLATRHAGAGRELPNE